MLLTRRLAGLLVLAGAFQWLVWPNFLRVVWRDDRAFDDGGPTAFLLVHVAIVVPALLIGSGLIALGAVAWRRAPRRTAPRRGRAAVPQDDGPSAEGTATRAGRSARA